MLELTLPTYSFQVGHAIGHALAWEVLGNPHAASISIIFFSSQSRKKWDLSQKMLSTDKKGSRTPTCLGGRGGHWGKPGEIRVTSILQDWSGSFPTSPSWAGTRHWDLLLPSQAGWGSHRLHSHWGVTSNPARGTPSILWELICHGFVTPAGYLRGCISPSWHRSPMEGSPAVTCGEQTRSCKPHQSHTGSWGGWANGAFGINGWKAYEILARTPVSTWAWYL